MIVNRCSFVEAADDLPLLNFLRVFFVFLLKDDEKNEIR